MRLLLLAFACGCSNPNVIKDKASLEHVLHVASVASEDTSAAIACPVESYNSLVCCYQTRVLTPETPEQVVGVVRTAMNSGLKVHPYGHAHTGNGSICADPGNIELSTSKLNTVIYLEQHHGVQTVVADAGVTVAELSQWLDEQHLSLGFSVLEFRDATIGGVIGTAAHGSALNASSVVADKLQSIWMVTPRDLLDDPDLKHPIEYDKFHHLSEGGDPFAKVLTADDEWKALATNLGVLGVVTRVRLRVVPQFNLQVSVGYGCEKNLLKQDGVTDMMAGCDFGQLNWFPRHGHVMTTCGIVTHDYSPPGATNTLLTTRSQASDLFTFEYFLVGMAHARGKSCGSEMLRYNALWLSPPLQSKSGSSTRRVTKANGPSHQMMSSDLTKLQKLMPQVDLEIAVPISDATKILQYIDTKVNELHLCFPLVGIFLRFSQTVDSSLLAHSAMSGQAGVMFVEFVVFRPADSNPVETDQYFGPYLSLAKDLIRYYHGRPHWAKNTRELFMFARQVNPELEDRVKRFRAVADKLDPQHTFANQFSHDTGITQ